MLRQVKLFPLALRLLLVSELVSAWIETGRFLLIRARSHGLIRQQSSMLFQQQQHKEASSNHQRFPFPTIWVQAEHEGDGTYSWTRFDKDDTSPNQTVLNAATFTFNWCARFVAPLELCPWTLGSLGAEGAIQIYIIDDPSTTESFAVLEASRRLQHDVVSGVSSPRFAICFCVFVKTRQNVNDFNSFYQWFIDLEDNILDEAEEDSDAIGNFVTIAPFHPQWMFDGDNEAVAFEKRSPFPTVSIVCTSEIDKAGEQATQQIGEHNAQLLTAMGASNLKQYYQENVISSCDSD